ncbi:MAG: radical SAM family heme chaperone HemW [Oribacterium sp.]|nr:radical SAM family heme chaperone HemW [Oribacterium sp.]
MSDEIINVNDTKQLELYIHIPFCARKCNYCDFLSFPVNAKEHDAYINRLCQEITLSAPSAAAYEISTIFIGGGTPSILEPKCISRIMYTIRRHYSVRKNAEITIELNPASTLRYKFASYRDSGINRISIGLQSANNAELKTLGRLHIFEDFLKCYQDARMEGFQNINIDLMNEIPGQTTASWRKTLRNVLMLKPEHVSIYNLIIEEGTVFQRMQAAGTLSLPSEDEDVAMDEITKELTNRYGYRRYEVSNYAKPGYECRHNYGYWSNVPYLGFGLGASSYFNGIRWSNIRDYRAYLDMDLPEDAAHGFVRLHQNIQILSRENQMEEFMFLGLRRIEGISELEFIRRFSVDIHTVFGRQLEQYTREGLLIHENYHYRFSEHGMNVSNAILSDFLLT